MELNDTGRTVVLITHEPDVAEFAKRVITLRDGKIVSDVRQQQKRTHTPIDDEARTETITVVAGHDANIDPAPAPDLRKNLGR
jgi:putative ABC transport system ATP-binding protein